MPASIPTPPGTAASSCSKRWVCLNHNTHSLLVRPSGCGLESFRTRRLGRQHEVRDRWTGARAGGWSMVSQGQIEDARGLIDHHERLADSGRPCRSGQGTAPATISATNGESLLGFTAVVAARRRRESLRGCCENRCNNEHVPSSPITRPTPHGADQRATLLRCPAARHRSGSLLSLFPVS